MLIFLHYSSSVYFAYFAGHQVISFCSEIWVCFGGVKSLVFTVGVALWQRSHFCGSFSPACILWTRPSTYTWSVFRCCCDQRAQEASVQSFTLTTQQDHFIFAWHYQYHINIGVVLGQHSLLLQRTTPITRYFCQGMSGIAFTFWSQHHYCYNWKAWAASMESFTLQQQATTNLIHHDYTLIACSCHILMRHSWCASH